MWNVVVDSSATAEQSQGAVALIGLHVKDHHLRKVAEAKTVKELCNDLETTYKSKRSAMKMLLRREINTLKLGSGDLGGHVGEDVGKRDVAFVIANGGKVETLGELREG
jgi:hypothetical protein